MTAEFASRLALVVAKMFTSLPEKLRSDQRKSKTNKKSLPAAKWPRTQLLTDLKLISA